MNPNGKVILITGGTGSLGKKLTARILKDYHPEKLIIFSRDELKQFEMQQVFNAKCMRYFVGDVRDKDRLYRALDKVDIVIHAAALKQIPSCEYNPFEAVKTNVLGAENVINASIDRGIKRVIALSTDKAVNPINLYGATKLCSDKLFVAANAYTGFDTTRFAVVRYGNVLASRGSVIPFFKERAKTGVLPITDLRMTRFWITLNEAADFVLMCLSIAKGKEIFVPKIPSMKIVDLARAVAPNCKQETVGIRPGEKLHEILIGEDDARNSVQFENHYIVLPQRPSEEELLDYKKSSGELCPEGFKYTSDTNSDWVTVEEIRRSIEQVPEDYAIETSRWSMKGVPK